MTINIREGAEIFDDHKHIGFIDAKKVVVKRYWGWGTPDRHDRWNLGYSRPFMSPKRKGEFRVKYRLKAVPKTVAIATVVKYQIKLATDVFHKGNNDELTRDPFFKRSLAVETASKLTV